jgi:hypothetical protein
MSTADVALCGFQGAEIARRRCWINASNASVRRARMTVYRVCVSMVRFNAAHGAVNANAYSILRRRSVVITADLTRRYPFRSIDRLFRR